MAFLEDYTLLDELGQGAFASVYKVRHNRLGYVRAIRVLNTIIAKGEQDPTYQKFLDECKLLLRLGNGNHSNIVHIYQPLLKNQRALVEMDFVDGTDIYHFLENKSGYVSVEEVINLAFDISNALAYCHEDIYMFCMDREIDDLQDDPNDGTKILLDESTRERLKNKYKVIHNDIHSGNIIRRENGSFVLLDFGLAIEGNKIIRSSKRENGAPEFKAPEKWTNEEVLTPQTDIYSFGILLYEFLTGRVPFLFEKKNSNLIAAEYSLMQAHLKELPPSIFELRKSLFEKLNPGKEYIKDYPDWLEQVILKCLEKDPKNRFESGKSLYEYIKQNINTNQIFKTQLADLANECDSVKRINNELQSEIEILRNNSIILINDLKIAEEELKKLKEETQESNVDEFKTTIASLLLEKETFYNRIVELETYIQNNESKIQGNGDANIQALIIEKSELTNRIKELQNEFLSLQTKINDSNIENSKKDVTIGQLQNEILGLKNDVLKNPKVRKWKIATIVLSVCLFFSVYTVGLESQNNSTDKDVEISSFEEKISNLEQSLNQKENEIYNLNKQIESLNANDKNDNSSKVVLLQNQIKEKDNRIKTLEDELSKCSTNKGNNYDFDFDGIRDNARDAINSMR